MDPSRPVPTCCNGQSANQPTCSSRPSFHSESRPTERLSRCGKCHVNKRYVEDFTSGWCNDCRRKLLESLTTTESELLETKAALTKRAESAEAKVSYLQRLHISPLSPDFKGDINFFLVGSDHMSCKLCKQKLPGFDQPIQAHRFILASRSPVFHQMLESEHWNDVWEKDTGAIEIHGVTPPLLRAVLNYMYTAEITFSHEVTPLAALKFAHKFKIEELKNEAASELSSNINCDNLKDMMTLATEYEADILRIRCKNFFQERF